jgi:hypothetical protein
MFAGVVEAAAVCDATGTMTLHQSTVSANIAFFGGGIYNAGTMSLADSTVSNNTSVQLFGNGGGGIYNAGKVTLIDSTVNGNTTERAVAVSKTMVTRTALPR